MIIGIGIDLAEVDRIADKLAKGSAFRDQVFSKSEIDYCEKLTNSAEHYAARFAAKEAFLKATGLGLTISHDLFDIVVASNEIGKPEIELRGVIKKLAFDHGWNKIHLSLSHIKAVACAVVIIER